MSKQLEQKPTNEAWETSFVHFVCFRGTSLWPASTLNPKGKTMKSNRRRQTGSATIKVVLALLLLLGGVTLWWLPEVRTKILGLDSCIKVVGTLAPQDLAEIRRLALREKWRGILPQFSWPFIRLLPTTIRSRASMRINKIEKNADGTVSVCFYVKERDLLGGGWTDWLDKTYKIKKGQNGWQIIEIWQWERCRG